MKNDPGFLKLRKSKCSFHFQKILYNLLVRAAQKIAKAIANSSNRVYLPSDGLFLNLADEEYLEIKAAKKGR